MTAGIPTTPECFKYWLNKHPTNMPTELWVLGKEHAIDLAVLELNKGKADYAIIEQRTRPRLEKFPAAYAKWNATK